MDVELAARDKWWREETKVVVVREREGSEGPRGLNMPLELRLKKVVSAHLMLHEPLQKEAKKRP